MNKYPICIISKDRAETCTTHLLFDEHNIDYFYMVEPQDYQSYVKRFGKDKVVNIQKDNMGVYYTRNFCINWSKLNGHKKHWQIDDNIQSVFFRPMDKRKGFRARTKIENPTKALLEIEEIADRCVNYGGGCFTHDGFAFSKKNDIDINKMIYCFQLINNEIKARYQPRTSEDVDFSVRLLKEGWVTMVFNKFSLKKPKSGSMKGGCNSSVDYMNNGRKKMNMTLANEYPEWFVEYEKNGQSEVKPSRIWKTFKQIPLMKK